MCPDKFSPAHRFFLSNFTEPRALSDSVFSSSNWPLMLGETPEQALEQFLKADMLMHANIHQKLAHCFTVNELKKMLRAKGLSILGNKDELIERLILNDKDNIQVQTNNVAVFICSDKGRKFIDNYAVNTTKIQTDERNEKRNKKVLSWWEAIVLGVIGNAVYDALPSIFNFLGKQFGRIYRKFEKIHILEIPPKISEVIRQLWERISLRIRRFVADFVSELLLPIVIVIKRWLGF
jgi:hypothetical protein